MMNCSVCSKRNALTYDEKSKKFFCESHSNKDLIVKEVKGSIQPKTKGVLKKAIITAIKKLKKK